MCRSWFARDVTAAMLAVKNKSISLLWELRLHFHVNSSKKNSIVLIRQHGRLLTWLQTKNWYI